MNGKARFQLSKFSGQSLCVSLRRDDLDIRQRPVICDLGRTDLTSATLSLIYHRLLGTFYRYRPVRAAIADPLTNTREKVGQNKP